MNAAVLYARSRRPVPTLLTLVGIAAAGVCLSLLLGDSGAGTEGGSAVSLAVPLANAAVVGSAVASPFAPLDTPGSAAVATARVVHVSLLVAVAALLLLPTTLVSASDEAWPSLVRNTVGYTGCALLGARRWGPDRSWLAAVAYGVLVTAGGTPGPHAWWAWPALAPGDPVSHVAAATLFLLGVALLLPLSSPRPRLQWRRRRR
ncbi:hypothetical protein ACH4U6_01550 [Streptomyces netropsis]|uniref:hypothetical protein n=1 Tax=Streptomyces netropsis TaxID=55404 RepID=UPI003790EFE3